MTNSFKKIFITGATHGIGKATAELFCNHGWQVFGISSNDADQRGAEMMQQLPLFRYAKIDVRDEKAVAGFLDEIGDIDAAFNNAGTGKVPEKPETVDISCAKEVIETNLIGTMICMKHEIKHLKKGVIINNASIAALKAGTGADAAYSASKAGIMRLTAEAAVCPEYRDRIAFFTILPGYIKTRMTAADDEKKIMAKLPHGRMGMPRDVADLVYRIIENNYAFTSGQCFNIDEGAFLI